MFITSSLLLKPGGFTGSAGTPNYLQSLDRYVTQIQWTESQIGALQSATLKCRIAYVDVMDIQAGNWVAFGCYGGTTVALSSGATSLTVNNCTRVVNGVTVQDIIAGDSILVTDGANAEIFKAASVSYSGSTASVTLGAAVSQSTTSLLNAYSSGATVTKLQWQGMVTGRKRSTDLANHFDVLVSGMMWRYSKVIGDFDLGNPPQDCATSIYRIASMYVPQVPEIIVSSSNFASANGIMYSGTAKHATLASFFADILKTESGGAVPTTPNEATYWAFWVDELRQAHHQQITTQATGSPTYSLDLINGSPNLYPNSDTLSDSTLTGLTLASGGPNGASDAEYTGTGSAVGSNPNIQKVLPVTMGQTYLQSWWIDPSQITNNTGSQVHMVFATADGLTLIQQTFLASGVSTAGRYATSAWTCPTNLAPQSDLNAGQTEWTLNGSVSLTSGGGPGGANRLTYVGTGSSSGGSQAYTAAINVSSGWNTFSAYLGGCANVVSGGLVLRIINASGGAALATYIQPVGSADGRYSISWNNTTNVSQIQLVWIVNSVVTSGQTVYFSQPMLEPKSSASGYYISSQNPQVQVFAQLLSSAIVTSGQKFKISQPMLTARTATGDWDYNNYQPWHPTNTYGDVLGPVQPQDMDMKRLLNCVLVDGGKDSAGNVVSIILTVKPSYEQWGYYEGYLSNPNITDKDALATWAAGQVGVLAWPQQTGKLSLVTASTRLTSRDLLQITGFPDNSTLVTNPTQIQYTADMKTLKVSGSANITQQQPNFASVMAEIANEKSIRQREIENSTDLKTSYLVSGCQISTSGLTWSTTAGTVVYNGTVYTIPAQSGTMSADDVISLGVQCLGTAPTGYTLPCVDLMPNFLPGSGMQRMNAHEWYELQTPGSGNYLNLVKQTDFQGIYLATLSSNASTITVQQRRTPRGGIGNVNLTPPTPGTPSVTLNSSNVTAEGAASAYYTFSATVSGMTFDDTIASVDVSYAIAGSGNYHPWTPCVFLPSGGSVAGVVHGLAAGQAYDIALQPRGRNGQPLGSPLVLGTSPTVSSSAITAALNNANFPKMPNGATISVALVTESTYDGGLHTL